MKRWARRWHLCRRAFVALTALSVIATACSDAGDPAAKPSGNAGVTTTGITGNVQIRDTRVSHPVIDDDVESIGAVVEITTDGAVEEGATVTVDAGEPIPSGEVVIALTADSEDGPWEPLPVSVSDSKVTASIEHLSWFSFLRFPDPTDIVEELFNDITSDLFASATPPSCDDEEGARVDGYEIGSEGPDVLMWCLGRDDAGRYLRVVNNRRYPVIVASTLEVRDASEARGLGDRLSDLLAGDQVALSPRSQVTYAADLEPGGSARIDAEFDGLAYSLYQLQFGVELAAAFLTRFGIDTSAPASLEALLSNAACIDALVATSPGRILTTCLDYDGLSSIFGSFGAAIATPLILASGVVSFFQTAAGTGWDLISGADRYAVVLSRATPAPPPLGDECSAATLSAAVGAVTPVTGVRCAGEWAAARRTDIDNGETLFRKDRGIWREVGRPGDPFSSCSWMAFGVSREDAFALEDGTPNFPQDGLCEPAGPYLLQGCWDFEGLSACFGNAGEPPRYEPDGYVYLSTNDEDYCLGSFVFSPVAGTAIAWDCPEYETSGSGSFSFTGDALVVSLADGRSLTGTYLGPQE